MDRSEEDARKCWCPFVRAEQWEPGVTHAQGDNPPKNRSEWNINCIASECMAWRWEHNYTDGYAGERYGYCGLAGKP